MSRFIYLCKKMIQGQCISKKIKFAEKVIRRHKIEEAEASELLDYIFYEDIQSKDHFLTNEEIEQKYFRLYNKAVEEETDRYVRFLEKYSKEYFEYEDFCDMLEEMEQRHNRFLS